MNPSIFREYDIRGLAEKDFDEDFARLLGKIHGSIARETYTPHWQLTLG